MGISFVGLERGMSMAEKKIEDFGEKIGGARKDLYALNIEYAGCRTYYGTALWRYS